MKYFKLIGLLLFITCSACHWRHTPKVATIEEKDADYYYNQGVTCYGKGNFKEALMCYDRAIAIDSTQADYYLNRGATKEDLKNVEEALCDYKKSIQIDSNYALAYFNIGCLFSIQKKDKEAIKYYEQSMILDPGYYGVYYNCAWSQYQIKDFKNAMDNFNNYCKYDNQEPFSHYYIGMIYKKWGQMDQAKEHFELSKSLGDQDAAKELEKLK